MGRKLTKDILIQHKKSAFKKLNSTFEAFINSPNLKHQKKADLIAYWIETYSKYLLEEERFDYAKIPKYKRGDIISVNFGFNVGSEQGGLHYALVLDNDNKQSSPVITVIPLSSGTAADTFDRDVFLGNELYEKLKSKHDKLASQIEKELQEAVTMVQILKKSTPELSTRDTENSSVEELSDLINNLEKRVDKLSEEKKILQIYEKEIAKLKQGSIALMEQITTISKMRIYKPKNSTDLLYGVKYSDGAMDKINEKIKELFVYSK